MQPAKVPKFNFYQAQSYGAHLLKGVSRNQVFNEMLNYPLLLKYFKKNSLEIQDRIIDTLIREPSASDCPGFIYGFKDYAKHKDNPTAEKYEIKMGRTKKAIPQSRIYEWEKEDDHEYVQLFTIRSEHNNKLESLVHLFFAYARIVKYINGKKRIEWFSFQERTLNAAATSMINQLMQKVQELAKKSQKQPPKISFNLQAFCKEITKEVLKIQFAIKQLLIAGKKGSGKSVFKAMLNGEQLKSVEVHSRQDYLHDLTKRFKVDVTSIRSETGVFEFDLPSDSLKDNKSWTASQMMSNFKKALLTWHSIYNVENEVIPCLVVTENDLLSVQMTGLIMALKKFLSFIKASSQQSQDFNYQQNAQKNLQLFQNYKLFIVVTMVDKSHQYCQDKLKKHFLANKDLLQQEELAVLLNSELAFVYSPIEEGKYQYNIEDFIKSIQSFDFSQLKNISFEYKDCSVVKLSEQVVSYAYRQVGTIFQDCFWQSIRNIVKITETQELLNSMKLNSDSKIENQKESSELELAIKDLNIIQNKFLFTETLMNLIRTIKSSKKQQQIVINLKKLEILVEMSQQNQVLIQVVVFSECMIKSSTLKLAEKLDDPQNFSKSGYQSQLQSPIYLSNSLIFQNLIDQIEILKQDMRSSINSIIDNQFKQSFQKILKQLYFALDQSTSERKHLFDQTYNLLFNLINTRQTIQSYKVQKKLSQEQVSYQILQEEFIIKSINDLKSLFKDSYQNDFSSILEIINLINRISKKSNIKTNSIISRLKEAIFLATKNKKVIPMIEPEPKIESNQNKTQESKDKNSKKGKKNSASRASNSLENYQQVKVIVNKDEVKNERLINYINSKKKIIQQSKPNNSILQTEIDQYKKQPTQNTEKNHQ